MFRRMMSFQCTTCEIVTRIEHYLKIDERLHVEIKEGGNPRMIGAHSFEVITPNDL